MKNIYIPAKQFSFLLPLERQGAYEVAVCDEDLDEVDTHLQDLPSEIPKPEDVMLVDPDDNPDHLEIEVVYAVYSVTESHMFLGKLLGSHPIKVEG